MPDLRSILLELLVPSVCPACDRSRAEGETLLCPSCSQGLVPLSRHRRALTTVAYEGAAADLIRRLKFEGRRDGLPVLVRLLTARVSGLRFDGIVPVPRHWERIRGEGCDPAFDLARGLSRTTGRPLWWRSLVRARRARPQVELALADRRRNLVGAFRASESGARGRVVLLVDDVSTSGATLQEAARELRRGGARRGLRLAVAGTRDLPRPRQPAL
ncbi:MAG: phosphoribosyltransferase family protein [Myxococcota bacterium]